MQINMSALIFATRKNMQNDNIFAQYTSLFLHDPKMLQKFFRINELIETIYHSNIYKTTSVS